MNDVKPETMKARIKEHPGQHLKIVGGQLWCDACKCNVGSGKQETAKHVEKTQKHKDKVVALSSSDSNKGAIQQAIHDFKEVVKDAHGEAAEVQGLMRVPEEVQLARAECLEEVLKAGIPALKIDKLRPYLERRMSISLSHSTHLTRTYARTARTPTRPARPHAPHAPHAPAHVALTLGPGDEDRDHQVQLNHQLHQAVT